VLANSIPAVISRMMVEITRWEVSNCSSRTRICSPLWRLFRASELTETTPARMMSRSVAPNPA
jgi:hypothetical protein